MADQVHVHRHDPVDTIAPEIYGHFAEHLGRCIYGGIWVGDDDRVATDDGLREDTVSLLRDLDMPVLRWPGGCFADDYHWEDGVGPREDRPRRRNLHWVQGREEVFEESNEFGTDEFVRLCDALDTEPYMAGNVGTGSPDELTNWAEYCNYEGDTELADRRRANDQTGAGDDGYDVKYWGVGNENWGCGGRYSPESYAEEYRRFANYLRTFDRVMGDGSIEKVAVGHINEDWNRRFLDHLAEGISWHGATPHALIDHLAVHRYYHAGDSTDFSEEEYYRLFAEAQAVADDVDDAKEALDVFAPRADIGVIVDEWGVWHPEADHDNGLEQENTVRDALSAAGVFDDLNARADVVTMGNIAQTVNVLQCLVQTNETEAWATPTYRVFDLYKRHMGATALRTVVDGEARTVEKTGRFGDEEEEREVPLVSASASEHEGSLAITASNRDLDATRELRIALDVDVADASAEVLFADHEANAHSTSENAEDFEAESHGVDVESGGEVVVEVPPSSVVAVDADL